MPIHPFTDIGSLQFTGNDLPIWSVSNFINNTYSNYLKLHTLKKILLLFGKGAQDSDFIIGQSSYEIYPFEDKSFISEDFIVLTSKDEDVNKFWHHYKYLIRPIVKYKEDDEFINLYEIKGEDSLVLQKLSVESPLKINLNGSIETLIDLFRGRINEIRDTEIISRIVQNVKDIVEVSHLINDEKTPPGIRKYANEQLKAILNKQNEINKKLGIDNIKIKI